MWIAEQDITDRMGDGVDPQQFIEKYFNTAIAKMNELTCNALVPTGNESRPGVVQGNGTTVKLEEWYSAVTKVTTADGKELPEDLWEFKPEVGEISPSGASGMVFGNSVELKEEFNTGEVMTIDGTYGFDSLPPSLKNAILTLMESYSARESGQDSITSKSIEDVSLSIDSKSGKTPEQVMLETQQPIVDMWSLCSDKYHIGELAYPAKKYRYPYFVGYEDRGMGGGQVAIGNVS